jgi:alkanesulfonate monooxygenase SsuD/methylene tetrahydromethanopterin reductase-like flavin-dependent oxidoreductase (luciferase family)
MKIGVSLTTSYPLSLDAREAGRQLVERARTIREAGLDSIVVGDHHATPGNYFQNVPTIGRLLAEAGNLTAGALFLAPLFHPVLMAEQIGTLAALAEGPFVVIMAAGDGEEQFAPFGVPLKTRPSRLEEHLTIVNRLLAGERLTYKGRYHDLKDVGIHPTPPEPVEIWIGASGHPAVERAGRMADAWLASPGAYGEQLTTQANVYRAAALAAGKTPSLVIRRDVYVGESDEEAKAATAPTLERGYRGFDPGALVIGGPDTVAEEFRYLHTLGFSHILVRHVVSRQDLVLASYRRLGEHVLPKVRSL